MHQYKISDFIARGGFGEIHEVEGYGQRAVIKRLRQDGRIAIQSFETECDAVRTKFTHRNIVKYLEVVPHEFAIIMEYCERGNLNSLILNPRIIYSMCSVVYWAKQIFGALTYLFKKHHFVHRDLKPANIFVSKGYMLKLGDFGSMRRNIEYTCSGTYDIGTERYMSPLQTEMTPGGREKWLDNQVSHRNDVYSLGLVLWEIIERRIVFWEYSNYERFNRNEFQNAILRKQLKELVPPVCQPDLQDIVKKCTTFSRSNRLEASIVCKKLKEFAKCCKIIDKLKHLPEERNQGYLTRPKGFDGNYELQAIHEGEASQIEGFNFDVLNLRSSMKPQDVKQNTQKNVEIGNENGEELFNEEMGPQETIESNIENDPFLTISRSELLKTFPIFFLFTGLTCSTCFLLAHTIRQEVP
ncbi:unnamed protein product, partial [Mesorhabditis belari]|uniref:Protein kinase domain-containing protein n=1 Tax=Mesorhabditis belari TaxID=2138241 RepID=A0AAF3FM62_9BILA